MYTKSLMYFVPGFETNKEAKRILKSTPNKNRCIYIETDVVEWKNNVAMFSHISSVPLS